MCRSALSECVECVRVHGVAVALAVGSVGAGARESSLRIGRQNAAAPAETPHETAHS